MPLKPKLTDDSVRIRLEDPTGDILFIRAVNEAAFGGSEEADLIDKLRGDQALISLVAECEPGIVGHILFSGMWIRSASGHPDQFPTIEQLPSLHFGCWGAAEQKPVYALARVTSMDYAAKPLHNGCSSGALRTSSGCSG
jgi:hypothetical protein